MIENKVKRAERNV